MDGNMERVVRYVVSAAVLGMTWWFYRAEMPAWPCWVPIISRCSKKVVLKDAEAA